MHYGNLGPIEIHKTDAAAIEAGYPPMHFWYRCLDGHYWDSCMFGIRDHAEAAARVHLRQHAHGHRWVWSPNRCDCDGCEPADHVAEVG